MTIPTLIIGGGTSALSAAHHLVSQGSSIIFASEKGADNDLDPQVHQLKTSGNAAVEWLSDVQLYNCDGFIGQFTIDFSKNGKLIRRQAANILVAEGSDRKTNFEKYGLQSGPKIRSLSEFSKDLIHDASEFDQKRIVFLNGLTSDSEPVIAAEILQCIQTLQALSGTQSLFLTGNLKVAGNGLEVAYRKAKSAGALFFKFTDTRPTIRQSTGNTATIEFQDEITNLKYRITPDIIVVDEEIVPSAYLSQIASVLRLNTDLDGFIQTENVHRLPVFTNRRGILAVGLSRAVMSSEDASTEAACGALAVLKLSNTDLRRSIDVAEIDSGKCIRCLTCYRLCPYASIKRGKRIEIIPDACAGCGICFAECPRKAIGMGDTDSETHKHARIDPMHKDQNIDPVIVAFCCSRSAARAHDQAMALNYQLPAQLKLVRVPCAGSISTSHVLEALSEGAAGVMVITCHEGNCHSETGNRHARRRVEYLSGHLDSIGLIGNRLTIETLAANMETEFVQIAQDFALALQETISI